MFDAQYNMFMFSMYIHAQVHLRELNLKTGQKVMMMGTPEDKMLVKPDFNEGEEVCERERGREREGEEKKVRWRKEKNQQEEWRGEQRNVTNRFCFRW